MSQRIQIRKSEDRGLGDHGWLQSRHTFSFAKYHDERFMGYRTLRVINEDRIAGGTGFGAHSHRDMEIISYVVSGALRHEDSMGNKAVIRPGEVQRMSAGRGVTHAEMNDDAKAEAHFFQIWILPSTRGGEPGYGQKSFERELATGRPVLVVSRDGRDGSIAIGQDAELHIARPRAGARIEMPAKASRGYWVQVLAGAFDLGGHALEVGDGAALEGQALDLRARTDGEVMIFDLT